MAPHQPQRTSGSGRAGTGGRDGRGAVLCSGSEAATFGGKVDSVTTGSLRWRPGCSLGRGERPIMAHSRRGRS
jgi:hypothetical protein